MTQLHTMIAHERHQDLIRAAVQSSLIGEARGVGRRSKPARRRWLRRSPRPAGALLSQ